MDVGKGREQDAEAFICVHLRTHSFDFKYQLQGGWLETFNPYAYCQIKPKAA